MSSSSKRAKVIPITRGFRNAAKARPVPPPPRYEEPLQQLLDGLHSRVRAVLVAKKDQWQFLERVRDEPGSRSVLAEIALPDLLAILARAATREEDGERVTISPWPGFDLAVMLRDGKPCYAACFDPETSIYIAESTLPGIARFFDQAR
ncbi:MAG: hypothetical protein U5J83_04220 [Bryobacterales bacterium]|nr:hypothetical protein [Bryobacterales bacterium]